MVTTRMVQSKELTIRSKLLNELLMAFVTSLIFGLESYLPFLTHTLPSTGRIKEQLMSNLRHELFERLNYSHFKRQAVGLGKMRPRHKRIKPKRHHIFNFGYKSLKLNNIIIRPKKAINQVIKLMSSFNFF